MTVRVRCVIRRLHFSILFAAFMIASPARASSFLDISSPFDYSLAPYFILEASLPAEYRGALDERVLLGITQIGIDPGVIAANDQILMERPKQSCSIYYSSACYDISSMYQPRYPQFVLTGMISLTPDLYIPVGVNSGFASQKLEIQPSILLGFAKRFYTRRDQSAHIILEYGTWLNASVQHRTCFDENDSAYYCENLSAWSDFQYDAHPRSEYFIVTYTSLF